MRDDMMGGLLAAAIAAPAVTVCCGGGGVFLAAITVALGGWVGDVCGLTTVLFASIAALTMRSIRRARRACPVPRPSNPTANEQAHG